MLVLSRRPNEKILFPGINASVQVVAVKPGVVRLGVEAPSEVAVFREEVWEREAAAEAAKALAGNSPDSKLRKLNHDVRNRLNAATIGLALLRRQVQAGMTEETETTLARVAREFQTLQQQVDGAVQELRTQSHQRPSPKPRRALVVEDDRNECELLAGFLRIAGLEVTTAGDGADALDYLRDQGRPDIVLLDMMLPRCDGPTTIRAIRDNPEYAGLKIFAVSGHTPDYFGLQNGAGGVDRWFHKPLNPEALLSEVGRELSHVA